jgi:TrmH family RNA methyltransferase
MPYHLPLSLISSHRHPLVQACRALANRRGEDGQILLDGPHLVAEALNAGVTLVDVLYDAREERLARRAMAAGAPAHEVTTRVLESASPVRQPSGIVAIAEWRPVAADRLLAAATGPVVALVDVQDPGNVGGIIRSADALGASGVLALDATANPGGWKVQRASMGSAFRIPVGTGPSNQVLPAAHDQGFQIVCANVRNGVIAYEWSPPQRFILLVGNEGSGLPQPVAAWADVHVTIPMRPGIDSLNVGIGTALLLSEVARRRRGNRP